MIKPNDSIWNIHLAHPPYPLFFIHVLIIMAIRMIICKQQRWSQFGEHPAFVHCQASFKTTSLLGIQKKQKKAQKIAPCFCSLTSSLQNGLPQASAHPHLYSVLDPDIIPSWANYHQNCVSTESSNLKMSIKLQCKSYIMYCMHRRSEIVCCGTKSLAFSICGRVNREWHWIGSDSGALAWALEALGGGQCKRFNVI